MVTSRALITGGTAGIGLEFVRQLHRRGCSVAVVARDAERLGALVGELNSARPDSAEALVADLATEEGLRRVEAYVRARPLDVLVNNAGFGTKGRLATTDPQRQQEMVFLHVVAVNRLTQAAVVGMVARGTGAIITVSSVASFVSSSGNVNYAATKAYQRIAMESLALELRGTGVYAQALCPGFTRSEFHRRGEMKMDYVPSWAWLEAEEVVRTSLSAMDRGGPTVVIPRLRWRVIVWLLRHMPRGVMGVLSGRYRR